MSNAPTKEPEEFRDPLQNYHPKTHNDPLEKALIDETVVAIQCTPVATVAPGTPVHAAVKTLAGLHVGCLLVAENGRLVGVFSDRDVLDRVALEYDQVKDRPVSELMTTDPVYVYETDSAAAALSIMAVSGFRHVPVTNIDQQVVGIVSPQRVTEFLRKHVLD
jgi:signal-transduction protein with cAMP-binding, CBS, and nucleotidyltransferase domain